MTANPERDGLDLGLGSADDAPVYQLRPPAADLSRFIEHYWFVTSTSDDPVDLRVDVFVDGRADLILDFGAAYEREIVFLHDR